MIQALPNKKSCHTSESCDSFVTQRNKSILRHRTQFESLNSSSYVRQGETLKYPGDREVRFRVIRLYEHPVLLGDNPGGARGPPLTIDWHAQDTYEMSVEQYEEERPQRRDMSQLSLPELVRTDMLKECGYSRREITELTRHVNKSRSRRSATNRAVKLDAIHGFLERVSRKALNALTFGRRKRTEKRFLERCRDLDNTKHSSRTTATLLDEESHTGLITVDD